MPLARFLSFFLKWGSQLNGIKKYRRTVFIVVGFKKQRIAFKDRVELCGNKFSFFEGKKSRVSEEKNCKKRNLMNAIGCLLDFFLRFPLKPAQK
jgi:hypothetical protein